MLKNSSNKSSFSYLFFILAIIGFLIIQGCVTVSQRGPSPGGDRRGGGCIGGTDLADANCICESLNDAYQNDRKVFDEAVANHPNELITPKTCLWKWN